MKLLHIRMISEARIFL